MTKQQQAELSKELVWIRDQIRNLNKDDGVFVPTLLSARQIAARIKFVQDDQGFHKIYRVSQSNQCVHVKCTHSFKITNVRCVGVE